MTEAVRITSSDGLELEAELDSPDEVRAVLVFCHPHPQMGGTMNAPLLLAIRDELLEDGWAVVRFNFRGIGASEGTSGIGIEETKDAEGVVAFAKKRFPGTLVAIAGWSFGGAVAVKVAAEHPELVACAAIAPAVEAKEGVTAGLPAPDEIDITVPLLMIVGANDRQVDPNACGAWAEDSGATFVQMKGANHFFWGKYEDLASEVTGFLNRSLDERGS